MKHWQGSKKSGKRGDKITGYQTQALGNESYKRQGLVELVLVVAGLGWLVRFAPLGSEGFEKKTGALCLVTLLYAAYRHAAYRLVTRRDMAQRWGLPFRQPVDPSASLRGFGEDTFGYVLLGSFFLVGAVPMLLVRMLANQPIYVEQAALYLLWCAVQDFLFFAIVLRNLEEYLDPVLASLVTALLFGLSHYPISVLMSVTTVAGGVWCYAFIQTRSLTLITLSHWLMGVILLS